MAAFSFIQRPGTQLAGGGAYITALIAALRRAGHDAVSQSGPAAPGRIAVIDGLFLPALDPAIVTGAVGLIHHTTALADTDAKPALRAAERDLLPRLRIVVATSAAVGARLVDAFGVAPERLVVIPPGVPDVARSRGSGGPGCAILSVGALVPRKGHATLLQALARLLDLDWSLTIIGDERQDPAHAEALRAQAAGLDGRVRFAGPVDDLAPAWDQADLFALATRWEGHPATIALALRHGLPVAITAGGTAAVDVTPDCGIVAPVDSAEQLSKAMRRMIFDPALRADMAEAAWRVGKSLPLWDVQAAKFLTMVT